MRAYQVGPGSSKSTWKATLDPGKYLPCSNNGGNRTNESDGKSPPPAGTHGQQGIQQPANQQNK